jgi:mRNA interferase RelE/StbE
MKIVFLKIFKEDIKKIKDEKLKAELKQVIIDLKNANNLQNIENLSKLKGYYSMTYRIKIGEYRLGVYFQNNILYLTRFVKKEDVYKVFPDDAILTFFKNIKGT